MALPEAKQDQTLRKHRWHGPAKRVTGVIRQRYATPASNTAAALEIQLDQQLVDLFASVGKRVSRHTIRAWRHGARKPPQWAYEILIAECRKRIGVLEAAVIECEEEMARTKKEADESAS